MSKLDFSDSDERQLIDTIFHNAISSLTQDDQRLPQVTSMLPILKRGIGIHHSGLLPILKEIVEILFQEGLLKCLFSTETFSMGLNMPAKTVVFTSVRKWYVNQKHTHSVISLRLLGWSADSHHALCSVLIGMVLISEL